MLSYIYNWRTGYFAFQKERLALGKLVNNFVVNLGSVQEDGHG